MNEDETLEMDVQLRGAAVLNPSSDSHHSFWGQNLPPSEIRKMQGTMRVSNKKSFVFFSNNFK